MFGGVTTPAYAACLARLHDVLGRGRFGPVRQKDPAGVTFLSAPGPAGTWDHQPKADDYGIIFAGEIRLDGVPHDQGADAAIAAYTRSGIDGIASLTGEFSFALWDPTRQELVLVRDHFGVRPLYYREQNQGIAFSSNPAALMTDDRLHDPSDADAVMHLLGMPRSGDAITGDIKRVLPGHLVKWQPGRPIDIQRYWSLEVAPAPERDAAETFAAYFSDAVHARMSDKTATLLSGGLDSSSVTTLAARNTSNILSTYSMIYPGYPDVDESQFINSVLQHGTYNPVQMDMADHAPLRDLPTLLQEQGGLFLAPGLTAMRQVFARAANDGASVLLDGHGGDEVAWDGASRVLELLDEKRLGTLLSLVPTLARQRGQSYTEVLLQILQSGQPRTFALRGLRRILSLSAKATRQTDAITPPSWQRYLQTTVQEQFDVRAHLIAQENTTPDRRRSDTANQLHALTSPLIGIAFENLALAAHGAGIDLRFPFYDRRLASFCLSLPSSEKMRPGEMRSLLRRSMADVLPPDVRNRQTKTDFATHLARGMARHHGDILDQMAHDTHGRLGPFLNMDAFRVTLGRLANAPETLSGDDTMFVWRAAALHLFETAQERAF